MTAAMTSMSRAPLYRYTVQRRGSAPSRPLDPVLSPLYAILEDRTSSSYSSLLSNTILRTTPAHHQPALMLMVRRGILGRSLPRGLVALPPYLHSG